MNKFALIIAVSVICCNAFGTDYYVYIKQSGHVLSKVKDPKVVKGNIKCSNKSFNGVDFSRIGVGSSDETTNKISNISQLDNFRDITADIGESEEEKAAKGRIVHIMKDQNVIAADGGKYDHKDMKKLVKKLDKLSEPDRSDELDELMRHKFIVDTLSK